MISVSTWRFTRDEHSSSGFLNRNRPSTDGLAALYRWQVLGENRSFEVTLDEDSTLEASLSFKGDDMKAGSQLDFIWIDLGISREQVRAGSAHSGAK